MADQETIVAGAQDNTVTATDDKETKDQTTPKTDTEESKPAEKSLLDEAGEETQKTDEKKDEQSKEESSKKDEKKEEPIEYKDFAFPDGVTADAELLTEFKGVAKELNLSQEQAQKLIDMQVKAVEASAKEQVAALNTMGKEWADQTKKEFGANFKEEMAYAGRARDQFASKELVQLLNETKIGNHPAVVKFFVAVGKQVAEDGGVTGKTASGSAKSTAEVLYPSENK